jgi:transposase
MEFIAEIRRRHFVSGESISAIAQSLKLSRPTVRKALKALEEPVYQRQHQPAPKLGDFLKQLEQWLDIEARLPKRQRRTARRLFEGLQAEGYRGSYGPVQRFVKSWKAHRAGHPAVAQAFVPLSFPPGETCQFDWSHEEIELGGVPQTVKVAHFRLAYSRQMFVAAYPRETLEMVMDAHVRAFAFFGGVTTRLVYDNLKTVVDAVFVGKERQFNRRFLALANHYLFEPVACTPAAGWEKGQVENQVGNVREWLFTPRLKFAGFAELNAWLAVRCHELAGRRHPAQPDRTVSDCFAEERPLLRPVTAAFDGYVEQTLRVSSTCLVRVDRNRYSVPAAWAGKVVSVRLTADALRVVAEGQTVAEHPRGFGREQLVCDPWHYLPVPERKPGALRHGAPFRDWDLPAAIRAVRDRILKQPKGDRAFVELLLLAREAGLDVLEVACDLALEAGVVTGPVVLNAMRRLSAPARPEPLEGAPAPALRLEPVADCGRYDSLRGPRHVHWAAESPGAPPPRHGRRLGRAAGRVRQAARRPGGLAGSAHRSRAGRPPGAQPALPAWRGTLPRPPRPARVRLGRVALAASARRAARHRRLHGAGAQPDPRRRDRHRQDPPCHRLGRGRHPPGQAG